MSTSVSEMFGEVREATHKARQVAFDGCHKIYLSMDDAEASYMRDHGGYECVSDTPEAMFTKLVEWYDKSCGLRFITAVENVAGDSVYTSLVPQCAEDGDPFDDEDDEDYDNDEYASEA